MSREFPSPTIPRSSRSQVLSGYLDYMRERIIEKVGSLPPLKRTESLLPSGWTPLELLWHLRHVENRWLIWGFEGRTVEEPWADQRDGRWHVEDGVSFEDVVAGLREQGSRTRQVIATHDLDELGAPGPRWAGAPPASLERILLHLLQEYARHLGHMDVVAELSGVPSGE
jgi:uncharacterized damage-inducible protein DinB